MTARDSTTSDLTILVTGATGNTGVPILSGLAERDDVTVRAMVRQAGSAGLPAGVQPVVADFDDPETVRRALEEVDAAYLVTPSSERAEAQQLGIVELAAEVGVSHLVVLSQLGSRADSPVRFLRYHAAVEHRVVELGLPHTFLRPNLFFQGFTAMAGLIAATGGFVAPIGDARVSAIDVRDIADVAVAALVAEAATDRTLTLTGPRAVTHAEIAQALGEGLGREVGFDDVAPELFAQLLDGILPPWQIQGTLEDYAHYVRGEAAEVTTTVEKDHGSPGPGRAAVRGRLRRPFPGHAGSLTGGTLRAGWQCWERCPWGQRTGGRRYGTEVHEPAVPAAVRKSPSCRLRIPSGRRPTDPVCRSVSTTGTRR